MSYGEARAGATRPDFHRGRPSSGNVARKPATAKGHDAVLKAIQDDGRRITISMQSGEVIAGTVVARDKFTISVRVGGDAGGDSGVVHVVYKHAMESFFAANKAPVTE